MHTQTYSPFHKNIHAHIHIGNFMDTTKNANRYTRKHILTDTHKNIIT
jgi:hypothetical protein